MYFSTIVEFCNGDNFDFHYIVAWFRVVQTVVVLTLIVNIVTVGMLSFYLVDRFRIKYYNPNRYRAFMINSVLMFVSGKLVHISTVRT